MSFTRRANHLFALVDCNNFYVSCERVFRPALINRPVVVLSNNDGCVIARSQEVKNLGVPMGAPYFQWKDILEAHRTVICSSNFALYGDLSHRVMKVLEMFCEEMEIYSIDEAFLLLPPSANLHLIRNTIFQWTGIPISIGMAPTKTLAKAANRIAKKGAGVCAVTTKGEIDRLLATFPVEDIWGIGRQHAQWLHHQGIREAKELAEADEKWIRKKRTVVMERLVLELRGIPCLSLEEEPPPKKTILSSRSFRKGVTELADLQEAVATYASIAAEKLRKQRSMASHLSLFLVPQLEFGTQWTQFTLPEPTAYTPTLIRFAKAGVASLFEKGCVYKKAGIHLDGLVADGCFQPDLFTPSQGGYLREKKVMEVMDRLNRKYGEKTIHSLAEGIKKPWKGCPALRSPRYTTQWKEILTIRI